jgi:putative transposase
MADTYTQLHVHLVFAVKYRKALIENEWKERMHQYMTGIIQNNHHKMIQINSMADHVHILIGYRPSQPMPVMVQNLKSETTKWINKNGLCGTDFFWQNGYGAFSYSKSHLPRIINYIVNQEKVHQKRTFLEEYQTLLKAFEVEFDHRYLFSDPE